MRTVMLVGTASCYLALALPTPAEAQVADTDKALKAIEKTGPAFPMIFLNRGNGYGTIVDYSTRRGVNATLARVKAELAIMANNDIFSLNFQQSSLTDEGLTYLKGAKKFRVLRLDETAVTDAGLGHLKGMEIEHLAFAGTRVTDAGLVKLKGVTGLSILEFHNTRITDAGLKHLEELTGLTRIRMDGTRVTPKGVAALKEQFPKAQIDAPVKK